MKEKYIYFLFEKKKKANYLFSFLAFFYLQYYLVQFALLVLLTHSLLIIEYYPQFLVSLVQILFCAVSLRLRQNTQQRNIFVFFFHSFFTLKEFCLLFVLCSSCRLCQLAVKGRDKFAT